MGQSYYSGPPNILDVELGASKCKVAHENSGCLVSVGKRVEHNTHRTPAERQLILTLLTAGSSTCKFAMRGKSPK
jgi:hypothetical protein